MTSSPFVSISTIVAQIWIQKRLSFHIFYDISLRYNDTSLKIGGFFMLTYFLNARGKESKYRFLYNAIRSDILAKKLLPGERLPSKRALAEHLGLSLSTVGSAYAALLDEGYLEVKARSGFFVSALTLPENGNANRTDKADFQPANAAEAARTPEGSDKNADANTEASISETEPSAPHSSLGELAADFPFTPFSHIVRDVLLRFPRELLARPENQGALHFRRAISAYLLRYRGMQADPAQIVIGSGTEYLYGLVAQLLPRAALYGIEAQSYEKIRLVYSAYARPYELLPLDAYGVSAEGLAASRASLLHVTPYQSYPSGVTATAAKRFEYLRWAKERGAFLVEDDYASEFSLQKKPLETIYAMDSNDSVIYLNTFTKTLAPSMRVAYMVLPKRLLESYRERLGFYACTVPALDQYVLAEYIDRGYLERRLNQLRRKLRLSMRDSKAQAPEDVPQPLRSESGN
jgi:transcriptional regulators containing a DNA-binding HTH domain and an aminotransferase domain (mocR family) and their eukaryotic orthologs